MKIKENGTVHQDQYSPSNIETGWRQKYYFKIEFDGVLDMFIEIFKKNGNTREIHKDLFEKNIDKMKVDREHKVGYTYVYDDALEVIGEKIKMREYIVQDLLHHNYKPSLKNGVKQIKRSLISAIR